MPPVETQIKNEKQHEDNKNDVQKHKEPVQNSQVTKMESPKQEKQLITNEQRKELLTKMTTQKPTALIKKKPHNNKPEDAIEVNNPKEPIKNPEQTVLEKEKIDETTIHRKHCSDILVKNAQSLKQDKDDQPITTETQFLTELRSLRLSV